MLLDQWVAKIPQSLQETFNLRLFGLLKIPLLGYLKPSVTKLTDDVCVLKIPFSRRSKNHLNSLYFGALAAGADCAGGLVAMKYIKESGKKIDLVFKDFKADFHKRAEGDTFFTNTQGAEVKALVEKCLATEQRVELPMKIIATTPDKFGNEPVATFILTISLKKR